MEIVPEPIRHTTEIHVVILTSSSRSVLEVMDPRLVPCDLWPKREGDIKGGKTLSVTYCTDRGNEDSERYTLHGPHAFLTIIILIVLLARLLCFVWCFCNPAMLFELIFSFID